MKINVIVRVSARRRDFQPSRYARSFAESGLMRFTPLQARTRESNPMNPPSNMKHRLCLMAIAGIVLVLVPGSLRAEAPDLDGDGVPNIVDPDVDGDGLPNAFDRNVDGGIALTGPYAGQYIGDHLDNDHPAEKDIDGDSLPDDSLGETDIDGDGFADTDPQEHDTDGDGRANGHPSERDMDGDGRRDDDDDEDDQDGDGEDDRNDDDDDNDGETDEDDLDHHPEDDELEVEADLTPGANAPAGSMSQVEVQRLATGKNVLKIEARDLSAGNYDILVGGVVRGTLLLIDDGEHTEGESKFETNPNKPGELPLDFDVFGESIALQQGAEVFFSGTIPTPPPASGGDGGGENPPVVDPVVASLVPAAGLPAGADALVEVNFGILGPVGIEVRVEDLPAGDYEVLINGMTRATLAVSLNNGDLRGQIAFSAESGGPGELPLDFMAAGQAVSIAQAGTEFFSGTIPVSPPEN